MDRQDLGIDFIPVIHRPNTSTGREHFGRSLFDLAVRLFDDLARIDTLTMNAGQYLGHPTIGASGGVYGLLLAFAMRYPNRIIVLLFPPIPMPAWLFAIVFGGLELFLGVTGTQAGVAHFAHLGGMLGGFLLLRLWSDLGQGGYRRR